MTNEDAKKRDESQRQEKSAADQTEKNSETSQMKVVQDKKKELEDRMKSQGTIRLRQPGSGVRSPQQGSEGQAQQEKSDTYKFGAQGKADEAGKTQATEGAGDQPQEAGAKRTLKIKSGGTGGVESKTTQAGGIQGRESAAVQDQQAPLYAAAGTAQSAGPGKAGFLANLIVFLASAVVFTLLLLYFLELYI